MAAFILDMSQKQISIDSGKDGGSVRWTVAVPFDMPKSHLKTLRDVFTTATALLEENDFHMPGGLLKAIIEDELTDVIDGITPVEVKSRDEYGQDNGPFETYYGNGNLWQSLVFKDEVPVSGVYYTIDGQLEMKFITDADGHPMTVYDKPAAPSL